jgi:ligand-binding sensor domain-containing protein
LTKFLLFAFLLCTNFCVCQTIIPRFETLGVNDGLPHSSVYSILQDKKGFMWFGTADGLCRYDGSILKTFKYTSKFSDDVVNNFVRGKMLEDKNGNIWFCNESGIYKCDVILEIVLKIRAFDKKEFGNANFHAVFLENNFIWIYDFEPGILSYNLLNGKIVRYSLPKQYQNPGIFYSYITTDLKGDMWIKIGASNEPFLYFNKHTKSFSPQLISSSPHAIFFNKTGRILAYEDRLEYQNPQNNTTASIPKKINQKKISFYSFDGIEDNYGRLWMTARGNGLFYFDEKNNLFQEYHHDNSKLKSLPFDLTTCLFIDRNENLWIGIDGGGVARIDLKQPKFNLFPLSEGDYPVLNDYFTKCFFEDGKGRIWFGSFTNGLNIYDPISKELKNFHHEDGNKKSLPGNIVSGILKDREGNMWIGSSGGFSLFNEKENLFTTVLIKNLPPLTPLLNNFIYKMIQLNNGDFLNATALGIIKIVKQKNGTYEGNYFLNNSSLNSVTTDVTEMPDKIIYATLPALGLYQLKPDGMGYSLQNIFLSGMDLRSVSKDEKEKDYLWIGSGKGLIHFNTITHQIRFWDEKQGLGNSYVYGSLQDSIGNLWISTNKGLSFFDVQQNKFNNYSFSDGLQSNEFNTQAFYKSSTGVFYFGGIKGFNWFKSGSVNKDTIKPIAAITSIRINDIVFQKDLNYISNHTIKVPYDKNEFDFQFAALDFTRPDANKVQYILEGWDRYPLTTNYKFVRYANLTPGTYTLILKVCNANGVWSHEEKIKIIITPPFWKRTWFIMFFSLLILTAVMLLTYNISQQKAKRRLQLLEKQIAIDDERIRISADMHDEIGSGITRIALLSELIQTQQKTDKELKKDINKIASSSPIPVSK